MRTSVPAYLLTWGLSTLIGVTLACATPASALSSELSGDSQSKLTTNIAPVANEGSINQGSINQAAPYQDATVLSSTIRPPEVNVTTEPIKDQVNVSNPSSSVASTVSGVDAAKANAGLDSTYILAAVAAEAITESLEAAPEVTSNVSSSSASAGSHDAVVTSNGSGSNDAAAASADDAATDLVTVATVVPVADAATNAFVLICAILVITMSIPGIALFYGGLVRAKNVLSIMQQSMVIFSVCFLLWLVLGYSGAFGTAGSGDSASAESWLRLFVGTSDRLFLQGLTPEIVSGNLSELNFVIFQGAFCAISACLIVGALAERVRFGALILAIALWVVFSYVPLAHMVWGGGLIEELCASYDFAGGTVVHINAAVAALVAAKMLGPRIDLHHVALPPHSLPLTYMGCGLLWVGWFGFNAGSELVPDGISALAFANTVFAPATAALTWALCEKRLNGTTSSLGSASGILAGLVAITPACAFVSPVGAIIIGAISSIVCLWGVRGFKRWTKIDDSLDVFGIHGLGAIVGALLTGIFCDPSLGGMGFKGFHEGMVSQFLGQLGSVIIAIVWAGVVSVIAFTIAAKVFKGLRVSTDDERMGLDISYHGERGYNTL